ncbi:uncharacterized protein EV420DRAFT_1639961 [Desarmillaria tabescens]|uniref:Uncharacterized protein n=1 Tax=Armillaria tabescens TaxID=1929756 RepID=A0AA39TJU6_ARMTA|nr:uncharacterized protein EV420DRAFT_1639961 [Desarmillaria tabescens]KAK0461667.1 hypothetical protein EV420DRAFT_1639961 [Desarmillaria tabescens]
MLPQKPRGYESLRASLIERQKLERKREEARERMRRRRQEIKTLDAATQSALKDAAHASQAKYRQKHRYILGVKEADRRLTAYMQGWENNLDNMPEYKHRIGHLKQPDDYSLEDIQHREQEHNTILSTQNQ